MPPPDATDISPWVMYPIVLLFFLALGAFAYWWTHRERRFREAFCERNGLELHEEAGGGITLPQDLALHRLAPLGADSELRCSMEGERDGAWVAVAFVGFWTISRGSYQPKGYPVTLACTRLENGPVPAFHLRPRRLHHRLSSLFARRELSFPEDPSFSARYRLQAEDPGAARNYFTPGLRKFFLKRPGLHAESVENLLFLYRPPSMWRLTRFRASEAQCLLDAILDLRQAQQG